MARRTAPKPPVKSVTFQVEQATNPDGSFTIRPKAIEAAREIGLAAACELLGLGRDAVGRLCRIGALTAWKPASLRDNGKWRINLQSVYDYKNARIAAARGE